MAAAFQVRGSNAAALFTLKIHRGEGMALLATNWRRGPPPPDFVGFAIEYRRPGAQRFVALRNRLGFPGADGSVSFEQLSTKLSPIQYFRWIHFPFNAELPGEFTYRVTPVFMDARDKLSEGAVQEAALELRRETYPGRLNLGFTRGFVSSQAFVDRWAVDGRVDTLLPPRADQGLDFVPTHAKAMQALDWMGFEARRLILALLDDALADTTAQVRMVAYDLNAPEIVRRLLALSTRLQLIVDDDGAHGQPGSGETRAAARLAAAGAQVKRQHLGALQHNKFIVVDGSKVKQVLCGSTNFSWRGLYVQANNALLLTGRQPVRVFGAAFEAYWASDSVADFAAGASAQWQPLGLADIDAQVSFSPRSAGNAALAGIAQDIRNTRSSLFYSLAFLAQTPGLVRDAIGEVTRDGSRFVHGMADRELGGILLATPDGNLAPVSPAALVGKVPPPFKAELIGGSGVRLHHKFVVIDFDKPQARVYIGSYNFSEAADRSNGENLLLLRNRRVAVACMVEALRLFDHYRFRIKQAAAPRSTRAAGAGLTLRKPPRQPGETAWWAKHYSDVHRIRDRLLFSA
ncbi:MAG: phospholipase D-like domain-containing protein [Rubrivivax sp.]|nr:phospholipase D-like domain-containing protein [Rubrivivax sp.]